MLMCNGALDNTKITLQTHRVESISVANGTSLLSLINNFSNVLGNWLVSIFVSDR